MKIYLAGPMRGYPEFNFPAFHKAAARLRAAGHTVFSPAEHPADEQKGMSLRIVFAKALTWICIEADAIAVLPYWADSSGATAEVSTARALHLRIGPVAEFCETVDANH